MASPAPASTALIRKRSDTDLMPPPPQVKRIKRPKKVIDEDSYTEALSKIISRDFFPGLHETEAQHEYLDALESKDHSWIGRADQRLRQAMTPGRRRAPSATPAASTVVGGRTPSVYDAATPASVATSFTEQRSEIDINVSLGKFQSTYTTEDNESFYKLVDKQNQKRAEKNSWVWNENKLPSKQMLKQREINDRLLKEGKEELGDSDTRPARPDSWKANPKNALMFGPDGVDDEYPKPPDNAKKVVYQNTRAPQPVVPPRPPSPTLSAIRDAVNGEVREIFRTDSVLAGGDETPQVNGYKFVDDEDEPEVVPEKPLPLIDLGSGDATPNPFKLQDHRKRETLHHRMVERMARSRRESSRNGFTGKVERTPVPKFPSSPRVSGGNLTPAAQRLLSRVGKGTPKGSNSPFGTATTTPLRARGSHLKAATKPTT